MRTILPLLHGQKTWSWESYKCMNFCSLFLSFQKAMQWFGCTPLWCSSFTIQFCSLMPSPPEPKGRWCSGNMITMPRHCTWNRLQKLRTRRIRAYSLSLSTCCYIDLNNLASITPSSTRKVPSQARDAQRCLRRKDDHWLTRRLLQQIETLWIVLLSFSIIKNSKEWNA